MHAENRLSHPRRIALVGLAAATAVAGSTTAAQADPFAGGTKVPKHAVAGDGITQQATGSSALVDGHGLKWFVNTAITFSTTSSASAAASEASFTGPTVASTLGGGTTSATLNDAFDGYNALATFVGPGAPTGNVHTGGAATIYNKNGALAGTACGDRELVFPVQSLPGVDVSRTVYVPDDDTYARWNNIVTNTGTETTTVTLYIATNLGSDSNTRIFDSSDGDTTVTTADSWVGSFQSFSGTTSSDPRLAHVLRGDTAPDSLITANFVDGDDNPYWAYEVTLAPGETRSVLNYAAGFGSQAEASAKAASIAAEPPTACLTPTEQAKVANFTFDQDPPVITAPSAIRRKADSKRGAVVTYTVSATDAVSGATPVDCTPASGSRFAVGTTTVTCSATDESSNTATADFDVTVSPYVDLAVRALRFDSGVVHFDVTQAADVRVRLIRRFVQPGCIGLRCKPLPFMGRRIGQQKFHTGKGTVSQRLTGKLNTTKVKPGRYRVQVQVTNAAGERAHRNVRFTVAR